MDKKNIFVDLKIYLWTKNIYIVYKNICCLKNMCCVKKNIYVLKYIFVVYEKYMLGKISIVGYKLFP